jgi:hypothetical protein
MTIILLPSTQGYVPKAMKFGTVGLPPYRAFSLEEIVTATNNFDTTSFIGEGSQGQVCQLFQVNF